jgi:DNA-binding beta-propeller fold protein YncE
VRLPLAAVVATAAVAVVACSPGVQQAATGKAATGKATAGSSSAARTAARPASPVPVAVTVPGCSTVAGAAPALHTVPTSLKQVPGTPFGVAVTAGGRWSFVALAGSGSVGVFLAAASAVPSLVRQVETGGQPLGEALTPGGRYLLVADGGDGAAVVSVSRAERGQPGALLGILGGGGAGGDGGAIEVAVSPDSRFAFVSLEDSASIAVYNLQRALARGFGTSDLVGMIPVGVAPVGMAVSPDGRWLYATSESAGGASPAPGTGRAAPGGQGTLTVIRLARAETDPAASVVSTVTAGCSPVRVITSTDGSVVWVTARESDRLLGFSAARLRTDPARSLVASVEVGEAPVGLALVGKGKWIVVADSNRFDAPGATSSLAVVGVAAALAGRPALRGYVSAGGFPREMALEPGGQTLLVSNFSSGQLETVDVAALP